MQGPKVASEENTTVSPDTAAGRAGFHLKMEELM